MNSPKCPFCASSDTQKQADFGTSIMSMQHYCKRCKSVFESIKWGDSDADLDLPEFLKNDKKK